MFATSREQILCIPSTLGYHIAAPWYSTNQHYHSTVFLLPHTKNDLMWNLGKCVVDVISKDLIAVLSSYFWHLVPSCITSRKPNKWSSWAKWSTLIYRKWSLLWMQLTRLYSQLWNISCWMVGYDSITFQNLCSSFYPKSLQAFKFTAFHDRRIYRLGS